MVHQSGIADNVIKQRAIDCKLGVQLQLRSHIAYDEAMALDFKILIKSSVSLVSTPKA